MRPLSSTTNILAKDSVLRTIAGLIFNLGDVYNVSL